ncbi:MAG: hypothetical protein AAFW87_12450 [Pseudomonadota bacterium]
MKKDFAYVDYQQLTLDPEFRHRKDTDNAAHLAQLRKTLRNTKKLDAILVWREADKLGTVTGRLVLLDGHYRVTAYRAEAAEGTIEGEGIPAYLITGKRVEAELAALSSNTRDALPLTPSERIDAAWRLVRKYRLSVSKSELSRASGVSERSIAYMRKKHKEFLEAKEEPNGNWQRDKKWPDQGIYEEPDDAERERLVATLAASIREAVREHRIRDIAIKAEAIERAFGQNEMVGIVDYLGLSLGEPDEFAIDLHESELEDELRPDF